MTEKRQVTVDEHYVPQAYLQGFSSDSKSIYAYRIRDAFQPNGPVPIKSICYKKNLYELRNENDEIVAINHLENFLCAFESDFGKYKKQLEGKAFIEANHHSLHFLSKEEKEFWRIYIAVQMMRTPQILQFVQEIVENELQGQLKANEARTVTLKACLPFFQHIKEGDKSFLFDTIQGMNDMHFAVGVDNTDSIFTSDYPLFIMSPSQTVDSIEQVILPITSRLVLILNGGNQKKAFKKNCLFSIEQDDLEIVKKSIACSAGEWIYSKRPLTPQEVEIVKAAYSEKLKDMKIEKE